MISNQTNLSTRLKEMEKNGLISKISEVSLPLGINTMLPFFSPLVESPLVFYTIFLTLSYNEPFPTAEVKEY